LEILKEIIQLSIFKDFKTSSKWFYVTATHNFIKVLMLRHELFLIGVVKALAKVFCLIIFLSKLFTFKAVIYLAFKGYFFIFIFLSLEQILLCGQHFKEGFLVYRNMAIWAYISTATRRPIMDRFTAQ